MRNLKFALVIAMYVCPNRLPAEALSCPGAILGSIKNSPTRLREKGLIPAKNSQHFNEYKDLIEKIWEIEKNNSEDTVRIVRSEHNDNTISFFILETDSEIRLRADGEIYLELGTSKKSLLSNLQALKESDLNWQFEVDGKTIVIRHYSRAADGNPQYLKLSNYIDQSAKVEPSNLITQIFSDYVESMEQVYKFSGDNPAFALHYESRIKRLKDRLKGNNFADQDLEFMRKLLSNYLDVFDSIKEKLNPTDRVTFAEFVEFYKRELADYITPDAAP